MIEISHNQKLLDRARELQTQFWDALAELEAAVGFDLSSTDELPDDIDDLGDIARE